MGSDFIQIYGSYAGPANTGVTANGAIIAVGTTQFVSPPIALSPGSNTIAIVGSTLDGAPITINRTVIFDAGQRPDVELRCV